MLTNKINLNNYAITVHYSPISLQPPPEYLYHQDFMLKEVVSGQDEEVLQKIGFLAYEGMEFMKQALIWMHM